MVCAVCSVEQAKCNGRLRCERKKRGKCVWSVERNQACLKGRSTEMCGATWYRGISNGVKRHRRRKTKQQPSRTIPSTAWGNSLCAETDWIGVSPENMLRAPVRMLFPFERETKIWTRAVTVTCDMNMWLDYGIQLDTTAIHQHEHKTHTQADSLLACIWSTTIFVFIFRKKLICWSAQGKFAEQIIHAITARQTHRAHSTNPSVECDGADEWDGLLRRTTYQKESIYFYIYFMICQQTVWLTVHFNVSASIQNATP